MSNRTTRQLIEEGLRSPWYRLALAAPLEGRYRAEVATPSGLYLQSWLAVFIAFNILSTWMDIDSFGLDAIAVPFGLTIGYIPAALVSIVACRGRPSQSRQATIAGLNAVIDMAIILNSARIAPPATADAYLILAAVVPFAAGVIVAIPFRHGLFFYGASFALFVVTAFVLPGGAGRYPEGISALCAGLILVPLKISFSREKESKRCFLLDLLGQMQADDLRAANERLTVLSTTDPLTGLSNRRAFSERFEAEWTDAIRAGAWLGVVLVDIDHFKLFNDVSGHADGDHCLIDVGRTMNDVIVASGGLMGRYGGEEFAAYLPDAAPEAVIDIAERLLASVRALAIEHRGLPDGATVSVSVGATAVYASSAIDGLTTARLLAAADDALYAAKGGGRDRVVGKAVAPPMSAISAPDRTSELALAS